MGKLIKTFFCCSDFVLSVNLKFTLPCAMGSQRADKHAPLNQGNAGQTEDSLTKAQQGSDQPSGSPRGAVGRKKLNP